MGDSVEQLLQGLSARLPRLLRCAVSVVAVLLVLLFCASAAERMRAPVEFDELEGYAVQTIAHVAHGGSLYPAPSFTFVPYLYSPGFYYVAATVSRLVHHSSFAVARSVSIASTLGAFAMIFLLVWKETKEWLPALAAAGLYAGAYPVCQAWFDIARLDSFYVFVVLCAIYATRWFHPVVAALFWVAVVQVKQPMLPVGFIMLCWDWRRVGRTVAGLITYLAGLAAAVAVATKIAGHWYSFYMFTVPRAVSDIIPRPLALFPFSNLFAPFGIACFLLATATWLVCRNGISRVSGFYLCSLSLFLLTWFQMGHAGSSVNVLMPMYALVAVLFGVAIFRLQTMPWPGGRELVMLAAVIQLSACIYNPGQWKAMPFERAGVAALTSLLRATPGDVYVPWHPYYGVMGGKHEHVDFGSLSDTLRALPPAQADDLRASIAGALCRDTTALVIDDPEDISRLRDLLHRSEGWNGRFAEAHLIPGVDPHFRPAWITYAQGDDAAISACMQPKL